MTRVAYALLADGPTDQVLTNVIDWLILDSRPDFEVLQAGFLHRSGDLGSAIDRALERFRPNLLIVHRDAEGASLGARQDEVRSAAPDCVPLVPVRMTEAWLLFDEAAIRDAAGNPNGTTDLQLPRPREVESLADPKTELRHALQRASRHTRQRGRARFKRGLGQRLQRVGEYISDYSPLRRLAAFRAFEAELTCALDEIDP